MNVLRFICLALLPLGGIMAEETTTPAAVGGDAGIVIEDIDSRQLRRVRRWRPGPPGPPEHPWRPPPFDSPPLADVEPRHRHRNFGGPGFGGPGGFGHFGPHNRYRRHRWGPPGFDGFGPGFGGPRRRGPGHRHFHGHGPHGPPPDFHEGGRPFRPHGPGHHHHHHHHHHHDDHHGPGGPHYGDHHGFPDYNPGAVFTFQDTTQGQPPSTAKPVLKFQSSCGVSTTSRIVGGEQVQRDDWSWTVALMRPARAGMEHFCGATLVSDQHMITAAHCVANMKPGAVTARAGYTNLDDADGSQDLQIEGATLHPSYNSTSYYADIAIVKLQQPVQFSTRLQPCCLPDPRETAGRSAVAVGWGSTAFGGPQTNVLQQVTLPIWNNQECQSKINIAVHDVMLCAGRKDTGGHDACQGDSGGPLLVRNAEERWSLEGIISFGFKCAQKGVPGVYTRVSKFKDWIIDNAV